MYNKHLLSLAIMAAFSSQSVVAQQNEVKETETSTALSMVSVVGQATGGVDDVISRDMLDNLQANDLNDVFSLNPEISAGGPVAMGQKVYVRNVGEDMLNISVDGAEQAGAIFHHSGRVVIEPDLLQQVEVEAGAGSATAGLGALGGAVRFVTKNPEDLLRGNETAGATLKSTYYSNGDSTKLSATVYATDEKGIFSGLANVIKADLNNRKDGKGDEIVGSESENTVGFVKLVADIDEGQRLSLSYESLKQEGDMLYKPEYIPFATGRTANLEENTVGERETVIVNYSFSRNPLLNLSVNAYQTNVSHNRTHQVWYPNGERISGKVETKAVTLQNMSEVGFNKIIYGINYREDRASLVDSGNSSGKEKGEIMGLYAQDIMSVNEQLTITTGLRFDDYSLDDLNGQKVTDSGVAPNLSANYAINPKVSVSAGYAEAIRGATVKDSYLLWAGGYTNSTDLKAEKAKNIEVAMDYNAGPITAAVGVYQSTIEGAIGNPVPWNRNMINLEDDIETNGYFVKAGYTEDKLSVTANFHSADTKIEGIEATRYVYGASATSIGDTLVVDANYQVTPAWHLGWTVEVVNGIDEFSFNLEDEVLTLEKEGYSTHGLYVRWSPMVSETLVFNLTVKNLFDENYINHSSPEDFSANAGYASIVGQNDAGRDIRFSAAVKF
jgi:hemoglobin/transferrin/lactoferrin receptor protein